jgi:hypothetical protein
MATTRKWSEQGTAVTLMSTELNSLAAGALVAASSTVNNSQGVSNLDGYTRAIIEANFAAPSGAFAANSTLDLWFLKQVNAQQEDGSASVTPARPPDVSFAMQATANAQHVAYLITLPPGTMGILARNNQASGTQALAASGNTILIQAYTDQGV